MGRLVDITNNGVCEDYNGLGFLNMLITTESDVVYKDGLQGEKK